MKNLFYLVVTGSGFSISFRGVNLMSALNLEASGASVNYGRAKAVRDSIIAGTYNPEIQEKYNNLNQ